MEQQATSNEIDAPKMSGNLSDLDYDALRARMQGRFLANAADGPIFETDAAGLWEAYLDAFPTGERRYHTCNACRRFVERFGGLVTVASDGSLEPIMWDRHESDAFAALHDVVRRAKIVGPFLCGESVWGTSVTGTWTHFAVTPPSSLVFRSAIATPNQKMAEKREDFKNISRALGEFKASVVNQVVALLQTDALYRSEKVLGPAQFLAALHAIDAKGDRRKNLIWRAIADAPVGFCHPRSSMLGSLLEDLISGSSFDEAALRFKKKMNPSAYQRPQAPPSEGNIDQAEKVVEKLGVARSLERRFARIDEIEALWRPTIADPDVFTVGVFAHLKPNGAASALDLKVPEQKITWVKFAEKILPTAKDIRIFVPHIAHFVALITAEYADAPPIFQWDTPELRNPFSFYTYEKGSPAPQWGLVGQTWAPVTAVTLRPEQWHGRNDAHLPKGVIFVIQGAVDTNTEVGNAMFPETLKSEFHGIRSTIEAFSKKARLGGRDTASACGLSYLNAQVRVTDQTGTVFAYCIDRFE